MFSPKWFNISIFYVIIIIIVYYTLIFFPFAYLGTCSPRTKVALPFAFAKAKEESKAKEKINPLKRNKVLIYPVENKIKNIKFNKLRNKSRYLINSLNRREYSTLFNPSSGPAVLGQGLLFQNQGQKLNRNVIDKISCSAFAPRAAAKGERLNTILKELELNPVYVFENLNNENIKTQILIKTKGLSGIYMIVNLLTKDYYIGSASTNRFFARFSNHLIYFRGSKIVKSAVKKYELKNFAFIILEIFPKIVTKENNKELLDLEDKYIKLLLPNYNILTEAGSSFGYKHTEVDRIKMKDIYSEARREKIGSLNKGKKLSPSPADPRSSDKGCLCLLGCHPLIWQKQGKATSKGETIEKMREKALNRPPMSNETKLKCISHTRPLRLYNLNGTVYGEYSTILEAAKAINCGEKTIRRALKTPKKIVKRQ
jgi:group I intron endonuclease